MSYILASVVFSVLVSVLLKLAPRWQADVPQAVAWNYLAAGGVLALLWHPELMALALPQAPDLALLGLGILLPVIFIALGASVRHAGIVRSDVAQRLSLLLSLLAAFALFGEAFTARKLLGIALGLLALAAMVWRTRDAAPAAGGRAAWLYPLAVFGGFAAIDILLKQVALSGTPFAASLLGAFGLSFVIALAIQLWRRWARKVRWNKRSLGLGVLLGLANAGNIICYVRGHQVLPHDPALVFASTNVGVVALGSLIGVWVFREPLSWINRLGLALALVAIAVLASSVG